MLGEKAREDVVDSRALQVVEPLLGQPRIDPRPEDHGVERLGEVVVGADSMQRTTLSVSSTAEIMITGT